MGKRSMVRFGSLIVLLVVLMGEAVPLPAGATGMDPSPPVASSRPAATPPSPAAPQAAGPAVGVNPALPLAPAPPFTTTPGLPPAPSLALRVEAQPSWAFPDEAVTVTLWARNDGPGMLEGVVVRADWTPGLKLDRPAAGIQASAESFVWPLPPLAAGAALSTTLRAQATAEALDKGHVLLTLEGGRSTPGEAVRAAALLVVSDPQEMPTGADIPPASGGRLSTADGRVAVDIPAGAVEALGNVHFEYRSFGRLRRERPPEDLPPEWAGYYRALRPFCLEAWDASSSPIRQFARPVTITVHYDPAEVAALSMDEVDLQLYWWDEDLTWTADDGSTVQGLWLALPSRVDAEKNTVTAAVDHLTVFALSDGSSPSDAFLPGVQGFQVSLFTGASAVSYPIQVPQGPGGLSPALTLSYSSAAYDGKSGSRDRQQAGWVGRGWSLGTDYIAVVKNPATGSRNRNAYTLVLNGVSADLVRHDDTENGLPNPHYHVADERFWAVWQENVGGGTHYDDGRQLQDTVWKVRTKDGTLYQFGSETPGDFGNRAWWAFDRSDTAHPPGCGNYIETYKWYLTKVTDTHGNTIEYSYDAYGHNLYYYACGGSVSGWVHADVWPTEVRWGSAGNLRFRVVFESAARTGDLEHDGAEAQLWAPPYETRQLNGIAVYARPGADWLLVRRYDLFYDYSLRPDNGHNYPKLTLKKVVQKGADGLTALPETTFTYRLSGANYTNGKYRLETVANGYGGVVLYAYQSFTMTVSGNHRNRVTARTVQDGLGNAYTWSYDYGGGNAAENSQANSTAIWYAKFVAHDESYLVHPAYTEFRGHRLVLETDPNGNRTEHWYYQGDGYQEDGSNCTIGGYDDACYRLMEKREALKGREWKTVRHGSNLDATYLKSYQDLAVERLPYSTDMRFGLRRNFAYTAQAREYTYDGDLSERHKTTQYLYDASYQGGTQWGNLTHVLEYGERDPLTQEPIRTTLKQYYPNPERWIVGLPAYENVYSGTVAGGMWVASTYYAYDGRYPFTAPGNKGELTRVLRVLAYEAKSGYATTVDTSYEYDDYGNRTLERVYNAYGFCQPWPGGRCSPAADDPRDTTTTYDAIYHLYPTKVTYPNGRSERASYDYRLGLVTAYTDVNDDTTHYRYDVFGRFWKMWQPGDSESLPTVENAYHEGTLQPAVPMMWAVWRKGEAEAAPWTTGGTWERRFYDGLGRLVQVQRPHDDWDGQGGGRETVVWSRYDGLGQKVRESVAYEKPAYHYDPDCQGSGRPCNPYVPPELGQPQTAYTYDPLGRVVQVVNPDGSTVRTMYSDWVVTVEDEAGRRVAREQDALGRLVLVREYVHADVHLVLYAQTRYTYDARDRLRRVRDHAGNETVFEYDPLGRKVAMNDPDMGYWTYAYDPLGNLTRQTDARGQRVCSYYDTMNRPVGKIYWNGDTCPTPSPYRPLDVRYQYDNDLGDADSANSWGRLRRAYVGNSPTANGHEYRYDERGQVRWETVWLDGQAYTTAYTYDSMGRVRTMAYPGSPTEVVAYAYLPNGALDKVIGEATYLGKATYTAWGALSGMVLGPAGAPVLRVEYTYYPWDEPNGRGRLQRLTAGTPAEPTSLQDLRYTYDAVGNILTIADYRAGGPQVHSFAYDDLHRLRWAQAGGGDGGAGDYGPEFYTYGGVEGTIGNLTSKGGVAYTYGPQSALCPDGALFKPHAVVAAGSQTFCYDANGNMVRRDGGATALAYDAENRLVQVTGMATATFVYGPGGERVKGTVNGKTTLYIGNHYEVQGGTVRKYYYAGAQRLAVRENGVLYWLLQDHLGSTAITANADGSFKAEVRYKAWGEDRYTSGETPTTYRYTGQRIEHHINLYLMGARWYDPTLGRWLSPDTIMPRLGNPQSFNRYSYVLNRPLLYTDPTGHRECEGACPGEQYSPPEDYGITFTADEGVYWDPSDQNAVLAAAAAAAQSMVESLRQELARSGDRDLIADMGDPADIFESLMGGIVFHRSSLPNPLNARNWWASVDGSTVTLWTQAPQGSYSIQNAGHEMGHVFDYRTGWQARRDLAVEQVSYTGANGQSIWVAGAGQYLNDAGYATDGPWQQNNNPALGGNSAGEEFADMYLGWSFNHFANDAAGAARYRWMQSHMPGWLGFR